MARSNRKCVICGNDYYYCNHSCADSLGKPSWMASFCSDNCRNIYNATVKYNMKKITVEEAKNILDTCDLSNKNNFTASTNKLINEIYPATIIENSVVTTQEDAVDTCKLVNIAEAADVNEISIIAKMDQENITLNTVVFADTVTTGTIERANKQQGYKKKNRKRKND